MIYYGPFKKIQEYTHALSLEQLLPDERTKDAVLRNIQVIGDASKNLPAEFIENHPDIDWRGIAGMRTIITHRYFHGDWNLVWISIHEELPVLKDQLLKLTREK